MGAARPSLVETLVDEEVRRIVAEAISDGAFVSASASAAQILRAYPSCGLDERTLTDRIMMAGSAAGVAVEIG